MRIAKLSRIVEFNCSCLYACSYRCMLVHAYIHKPLYVTNIYQFLRALAKAHCYWAFSSKRQLIGVVGNLMCHIDINELILGPSPYNIIFFETTNNYFCMVWTGALMQTFLLGLFYLFIYLVLTIFYSLQFIPLNCCRGETNLYNAAM